MMRNSAVKSSTVERKDAGKEYKKYVSLFSEVWNDQKPLAKLFRTVRSGYLYDTGTNKILECNELVFDLLQNLYASDVESAFQFFVDKHGNDAFLQAVEEIIGAMEEENIFKTKIATQFGLSDHFHDIDDILNTTVQSITLEVTQACNLRCLYCIYHDHFKEKRNYGQQEMSLETAKKAIRFLKKHSSKTERTVCGFYGGEPLLRPRFLEQCVDYAKEIFDNREILFTVTTNAVLVTPEIAEFLFTNGFSATVSLDGPAIYHDRYRKDAEGEGSFERTLNGLKLLVETYGESAKGKISLNMVYTPPYSEKKINTIETFLKELEWLPDVNVRTTYPTDGTIPQEILTAGDLRHDKNLTEWAVKKYGADYRHSLPMVKGMVENRFARLIQRYIFKEPVDSFHLNGCCVPGQRKNYIAVDGGIHVCEKISTQSPVIGHVDTGFDLDTLKKVYIDHYAEASLPDCSGCWGIRHCDICYISSFNEKGVFDLERKRKYCNSKLKALEQQLADFVALSEKNPDGLNYLYQYDIN